MMAIDCKNLFYSLNLHTINEKWKKKEKKLECVQCEEKKLQSPSIPRAPRHFLNQLIFHSVFI
jgi:hypothetical protein